MKRAFFVLTSVLVVLFAPYVFGQKTLLSSTRDVPSITPGGAYGDSARPTVLKAPDAGAQGWQMEPTIGIEHRELFATPQWPLWNPYSAFGSPLAADMISQPFYPLSFALALLPNAWTYDLWVLARLLIAGIGAFAFVRLFAGTQASLLAGVSMMLTGYYMMHYGMAHLSVEVLLPALLYAVERAIRRFGAGEFVGLAVMTSLVIFGGMPESTILVFGAMYLYVAARLVPALIRGDRATMGITGRVAATHVLGVALAAALLFPFAEFLSYSFNTHSGLPLSESPGVWKDPVDLTFMNYIAPLIFGPPRNNILAQFNGFTGLRGYIGIAVAFLGTLCFVGSAVLMRQRRALPHRGIIAFFSLFALLILAKRYGLPPINWIGMLPGLRFVIFPKYEEVELAFACSVLAAFGLEMLLRQLISRTTVVAVGLGWLLALTGFYYAVAPQLDRAVQVGYFIYAFGLIVIMLAFVTTVSYFLAEPKPRPRRLLGIAILAIATIELALNYVVPLNYVVNQPSSAGADAYNGAPYVTFLQKAAPPEEARVFGTEGFLYPSWPGVFGLADATQLNAIYYGRYLPFVSAFLAQDGVTPAEFADRFTGTAADTFETPLETRFLQLGSLRYVVASKTPEEPGPFTEIREELKSQPDFLADDGVAQAIQLGAVSENAFFMKASAVPVSFSLTVPAGARGIDVRVGSTDTPSSCSQPERFRLILRNAAGARSMLERTIPPGASHWIDGILDARPFQDETVTGSIDTAAPPRCRRTVAWSITGFEHGANWTAPSFRSAYTGADATVYEVTPVLPRAALFHAIVPASSAENALSKLTAPGFDVFRRAVVESGAISGVSTYGDSSSRNEAPAGSARIERYTATDVVIQTSDTRPSLLMLNDTNYPGWTATLDGQAVPILRTDYLFRGVVLPLGQHRVEFTYFPRSFSVGLIVSTIALLIMITIAIMLRRRPSVGAV